MSDDDVLRDILRERCNRMSLRLYRIEEEIASGEISTHTARDALVAEVDELAAELEEINFWFLAHPATSTSSTRSPSHSHSATLTTTPVPSRRISPSSPPAYPGEVKHFMRRSPGGSPYLHSYKEALDKANGPERAKCNICFDKLFNRDPVVVPNCGHPVHEDCFLGYHHATGHKKCATCRKRVSKIAYDIEDPKTYKEKPY